MKKIKLEMSLDQANLIVSALDLYSRLHMGQFTSLYSFLRVNGTVGPSKQDSSFYDKMYAYDEAEEHLRRFSEALGYSYNGSWGILSSEVPNVAREAWDIQQVLRQVESWTRKGKTVGKDERDWNEMMGVSYDNPMLCSGTEPVKAEAI